MQLRLFLIMCRLLELTLYLQALAKWLDVLFINQKANSPLLSGRCRVAQSVLSNQNGSFVLDIFITLIINALIMPLAFLQMGILSFLLSSFQTSKNQLAVFLGLNYFVLLLQDYGLTSPIPGSLSKLLCSIITGMQL